MFEPVRQTTWHQFPEFVHRTTTQKSHIRYNINNESVNLNLMYPIQSLTNNILT